MAWIESHQQLERHRKTRKLMHLMGWNLSETIGSLHRFWWWCIDYAEDGDLRKFENEDIADCVEIYGDQANKFVDSLVRAGWIDTEPYLRVHDWWDYIGLFMMRRYGNKHPERWQSIKQLYTSCTTSAHQLAQPNLTKPNLTIKDTRSKKSATVVASDPEFEQFWSKYPKKVGKGAAIKAFKKIKPTNGTLKTILNAVDDQKSSQQWLVEGGRYIPNPATWLNQERWHDELQKLCGKCAGRGIWTSATGYEVKCDCQKLSTGYPQGAGL